MLNNKVIIITGAANGIGRSTALKFAGSKYCLTIVDKDFNGLEELRSELNKDYEVDVLVCAGDLSELEFVESIITETMLKWGRIDVLINNAAWRTIETMRTIELETWEKTLRICLTAPAFLAKWSASVMEAKGIAGVIINISSILAIRASGNCPAYVSAKGAMESLTYELAATYGRNGIRVLSVSPGVISTSMGNDYINEQGENISERMTQSLIDHIPLAKEGMPENIAETVFWLSSESASYITGTNVLIDGGLMHNLTNYIIKNKQFPKEF